MKLNDPSTHHAHDEQVVYPYATRSGSMHRCNITLWRDVIVREKEGDQAHREPFDLIRVEVKREDGSLTFKRPMWLSLTGSQRSKLTLKEAFKIYQGRFDIEGLFRHLKSKMLMTAYQTPHTAYEAAWVKMVAASFNMLYLAKDLAEITYRAWEQYGVQTHRPMKPGMVQRGFAKLLLDIGTPAKSCKPRGRSGGRSSGTTFPKRPVQPIILKGKMNKKSFSTRKKSLSNLKIEEIPQPLGKVVQDLISQGLPPPKIHEMVDICIAR